MIKFFRHIRKELMESGKTGKYLKYAIGEILLVVIGILIALQINNWNEDQKTKKFEEKLLTELIQSLETDIHGLRFVTDKNTEIMELCMFLIDLIEGKHVYHDSLNTYFYNAHNYYHHSLNRSAYETSNSHGLYFIKNDSARSHLSQLYEWQTEMNDNLRQQRNDFYALTIEPFLAENFEFIMGEQKGLIPLDQKALFNNPKYKFIIQSSISKTRSALYWQKTFLDRIEQIQMQLKSEVRE